MIICKHYIVSGRVQGVSYRSFLKREAGRIGVTGWGRNLPDGTVEVFARGNVEQLDELEKALYKGSDASIVDSVEVDDAEHENCDDFFIKGIK